MKLIYKGKELDPTLEWELFSELEYGFDVTIHFKPNSGYDMLVQTYRNTTEVHHLYNKTRSTSPETAFESDFHATGCTHKAEVIEHIEIVDATEWAKEF